MAFNSDVEPDNVNELMNDMRQLALSLQIPWPLPDDDEAQAAKYMTRIQAALFGGEIEKALAGGK